MQKTSEIERHRQLAEINQDIEPLGGDNPRHQRINAVGREFGYAMIFNKYQSGLVYADDAIDVTNLVIERFNAAGAASGN